ncbi:hypothetical protein, conserved [Plasmodium ovale wallikeri]|uniref:SprT-like domain-containing protein n=1 Tax=Plasmodium ovale wallikeri TaxID=864142 RepID=A0A1A8ZAN8_PLAOA|nr:hypothetical protein, conserved [Plasmodium ovale wallikeri]
MLESKTKSILKMDGEITKLTSVENEYLQKSGKKRRQKSLIDVSSLNDLGDEHKMGSFPGAPFSSSDNVSLGEPKKSCAEVSTELQSESGDDEEEDPDTQAVMRQLSSIQIESDRESSSSDNGNNDKDIRDDKKGNDTDMVVFNKKENTNSKKEKKKKKKGVKKKGLLFTNHSMWNALKMQSFMTNRVISLRYLFIHRREKKREDPSLFFHSFYRASCCSLLVSFTHVFTISEDTEFPDLQELFCEYNARYFFDKLKSVQVKWSNKMKLCAGICVYKKSGYCCIRLSLPLLKLRKIKEYRETLLHEMIHAFLFLTRSNSKHDGHGPEFKKHMYRINRATGLCITIYHSFHKEVNFYRNHVWRCTRSMNRPPGPKEKWCKKSKSELAH